MSRFVDKNTYHFQFISKQDGLYLKGRGEEIKIDFELANYYLENHTLQKGAFINVFRKIECEDGEVRFLGKEHYEYKKAVKEETISIKNIDVGEVLIYYNDTEYIFLGSFYEKHYSSNPIRKHAFYDKTRNRVQWFRDLKKFTEISGFEANFVDKVHNYEKYIEKDNRMFSSYYLTIAEAKEQ